MKYLLFKVAFEKKLFSSSAQYYNKLHSKESSSKNNIPSNH